RPARRSSHVPPKRSSTRTDTAAAPARWYAGAMAAGSAPGRRSPADGERRLISAIAPRPSWASASRNLPMREFSQLAEPGRRRAGVDRRPRPHQPLAEVRGMASRRDRTGGVQQHRVALAACGAAEDRLDRPRVLLRGAALELGGVAGLDAELGRIDRALVDGAVDDLADEVGTGGRELVDAAEAVHDERATRPELCEGVGERAHERGGEDAEDAGAGTGRVRQWSEHVEDRAGAELTPHRRRVLHRRMVRRSEHEAEPQPVDRLGDPR